MTAEGSISTSALLPVVNFIGGTTVNCGGLWKYLRNDVFSKKIPVLCETTHFVNFGISKRSLENWREKSLRSWFKDFKAPLFIDSGGFQLLNNKSLEFQRYGLEVNPEQILHLQMDFGANILATLDYPLPPNLNDEEAKVRIKFSIQNSIRTLRELERRNDCETLVYIPVHGRDSDEIESFLTAFVKSYRRCGISREFQGFAIGSLVPISKNPIQLVQILVSAKRRLAELGYSDYPVHAFGIGSTFIPLLIYLGIDTFDSSRYVQSARNLQYSDPDTWVNHRATSLRELRCTCGACKKVDVDEMRDVLTSEVSFQSVNHKYKSEFYAAIASHNLNLHLGAVAESIEAAETGNLEDYLIEFTRKRVKRSGGLDYLASVFPSLQRKWNKTVVQVPRSITEERKGSLRYKPSDFTIPDYYDVPEHERILFLFPCSKEKPYSTSRTFKQIAKAVESNLNGLSKRLHFVVVSGLYGPVPLQFENFPETQNYDYVLTFRNTKGIEEVGKRLTDYLEKYSRRFDVIVALAPSKPYRRAMVIALKRQSNVHIFPKLAKGESLGRTAQQHAAVQQCVDFLKDLTETTFDKVQSPS